MINRVSISGVLDDTELTVETINNKLLVVTALLITQNSTKDQQKKVKINLYNNLAKTFVNKQTIYKNNLCMYYGEVSYIEGKDTTIIKINSLPTIISAI